MHIMKYITSAIILFTMVAWLNACEKSSAPTESSATNALEKTTPTAHHHDDHDHDHDHDHGYRAVDAHQHGAAAMTLVLEGELLSINLNLPAMDVLGFERAAKTEQEQHQLGQAVADLRDAKKMLTLTSAALCELSDAEVQSGLLNTEQAENGHADFLVYYEFTCHAPGKLSAVGALIFKRYPTITALQLTWIIDAQQGLETLSPDNATFHF